MSRTHRAVPEACVWQKPPPKSDLKDVPRTVQEFADTISASETQFLGIVIRAFIDLRDFRVESWLLENPA